MSATIGDGMSVLAIAGGIFGYYYVKQRSRQKQIEIVHEERMKAMEKGIPLPEFPLEPAKGPHKPDPDNVIPILGTVLLTLSLGTMIALYVNLPAPSHFWIGPMPFAFLGAGLIASRFLTGEPRR